MSLTVLITNIILSHRTGTEVVVEQLADGLRRRGHRPIVFAQSLGALADSMRARGHLIVDRPDVLPWRPDVVHAHHTAPAMAALAAHPGVPALFVCHDACAAYDALPPHPRVRRIFAVDERCRARLIAEGTDVTRVELLPNAVDLSRIPDRAPLPERPARAVAVSKHSAHLSVLRAACETTGITFEEFGAGAGQIIEQPEEVFAHTDLVFATARTALEAAAAGAGVIVCDARGCAGFLSRANAKAWLPWNLGAGILSQPTDAAHVGAAIANWSAKEAAAASVLIRTHRGLEEWLDRLEGIYAEMLAQPASADAASEAVAVGAFIAHWVPHFGQDAPWRRLAEQVAQPPLGSPLDLMHRGVATLAQKVDDLRRPPNLILRLKAVVRSLSV